MNETKIPKVTRFIKRLFRVVNDDSFPEINWTEDGLHFFISDKNAFMSNGLKYLSKTTEYSAFVRLLYVYGFTKSKTINANADEYFHRNFQRNGEKMLNCIKRIVDKQPTLLAKNTTRTPNQLQDLLQYLNSQNFKLENEIRSLRERVDQQDLTINGLVQILGRMFRTSDNNVDLAINTNQPNKSNYNPNFFNLESKKYTEENKKHRFNENYNQKDNGNSSDMLTKNSSIFDFDEDDQYEPSFF